MDIFLLYNHYPKSYPNFGDNHEFTIGYILFEFYTIRYLFINFNKHNPMS